jgi:hypothetical protein
MTQPWEPLPCPTGTVGDAPPPRLLDQLRVAARAAGHSEPAVSAFTTWSSRYIRFHGRRHPRELGLPHLGQFLAHVVATEKDQSAVGSRL